MQLTMVAFDEKSPFELLEVVNMVMADLSSQHSVDLRDVKFDVRCGHKFHPACLQEYIAKYDAGEVVLDSTHPGAVCPVCRERLIVDLAPPWRTWFAPRPEAV